MNQVDLPLCYDQSCKKASTTQKSRVGFFDLAKGFCICLVVFDHIRAHYGLSMPASDMIRSMRLPLYFFLSGCFFKTYSGFVNFILRKTNKLIIPFVFWFLFASLFLTLVLTWCGIIQLRDFQTAQDILNGFVIGKYPNNAIWFLLCLFWVNILFYVILIIAKKFKHTLAVVVVLSALTGLLGVTLCNYSIEIPFFVDSAFTALPFFIFGYLLYRYSPIVEPNKYDKWIPLIIVALLILMYFFSPFYVLKYNKGINYQTFLAVYLCGFAGTLCVVLLSKWIKKLSVFNFYGRYSIMILVSHFIVYQVVGYVLNFSGLNNIWLCLINFVVTMAVYLLLIPFFIRFMPHVTAQKDVIPVGDKKSFKQ